MQPVALLDGRVSPSSGERVTRRTSALLTVLVGAAAAIPIAIYLWIALHRLGYPYELDWMEGGSVELAARVLNGHSLYSAPSVAYVGWTYPPLYYWLVAGVGKIVGIGFLPLRLVSFLASLAAMATLGLIVARETGNRVAGLAAAGLFAATYRISGAWFDTGRVDSLFVALTLVALAYGRYAKTAKAGVALGVLGFLAFFTKQSALIAVAPAIGVLAITRPRAGVPAIATLAALVAGSTLILQAATKDWYGYYIYGELVHQGVAQTLWVGFWRDDVWHQQWPVVLLIAAGAVALATTAREKLKTYVYWAAAAAGLIGAAWVSRLHNGGYANVLMPAYAAVALLAGLAYGALATTEATTQATTQPTPQPPARRLALHLAAAAAVAAQLALLAYPIAKQIPTAQDRTAGRELMARLRALPGPVIVLRHPWYATLAGKGTFAQEEAIGDVTRSTSRRGARALSASLATALDAYHVQAVVLDGTFDAHLLEPELSREFRLQRAPVTPDRLYPLTDTQTSPTLLYLRRRTPRRSHFVIPSHRRHQ